MVLDPARFFEAAREYDRSADNVESVGWNRCATIDPDYTGIGPARVQFDGETAVSQKAYGYCGNPPLPGKRAFLVPIGNTYLIMGPINGGV